MANLANNISENLLFSIGWTIFHSVWIGAVISLLLFLILTVGRRWNTSSRYILSYTGLLIFFAACTWLFFKTLFSGQGTAYHEISHNYIINGISTAGRINSGGTFAGEAELSKGIGESIMLLFGRYYYILASGWLSGILILALRFAGGAYYTRRIRKSAILIRKADLNKMLNSLKLKLGIRRVVRLAESALAKTPMVIGSLKPYILIPLGSLTGVPSEQLETILLHELAHIRRNDFFLNLIQSFIEIVLFYHPATWWISSVIRKEREYCCDSIVLSNSHEKLNYIKALLLLSENREKLPVSAVAVTGSSNNTLERIKIMVNMKRKRLSRMDKTASALMSLLVILGIMLVTGFREPAEKATVITEIPESVSELEYPDSTPVLLGQLRAVQDTIRISGRVHRDYLDPTDNREKEVTLSFKNGKLTELIIDGKTISASEYQKYNDLVNETREDLADAEEDMADALEDIEESLAELEELDVEKMQAEIREAMKEIEELDVAEMLRDIEESLQDIKEFDMDEINTNLDEALMEIEEFEFDMQDIMTDLKDIKEGFLDFDLEHFEEEMARAMEEIKNIDKEEIRREFERSLQEMEDIDYEKIRKEMEESMSEIEKSLKNLEIDYRKSMEEYRKEVENQKREFKKQLEEEKRKEKEKKNGLL